MLRLRQAWLYAIGCALVIGGGSGLLMRFELLDPAPTLVAATFGHALALHGLGLLGALLAAVLAIPALVVKPRPYSIPLGFCALALWAAALLVLIGIVLSGDERVPTWSVLYMLGGSLALGAAQVATSLRGATREQLVPAGASLVAIAILLVPIATGKLPAMFPALLATTVLVVGVVPGAAKQASPLLLVVAIVPSILLAWAFTELGELVHIDHYSDTVASLAPLPVTGGALFGTLVIAATHWRMPRARLALVGSALVAAGTGLTSIGFFVLGAQGMPRRYLAYLPEFRPLHVVVGVAALLVAIGCVATIEAFRRGTPIDAEDRASDS